MIFQVSSLKSQALPIIFYYQFFFIIIMLHFVICIGFSKWKWRTYLMIWYSDNLTHQRFQSKLTACIAKLVDCLLNSELPVLSFIAPKASRDWNIKNMMVFTDKIWWFGYNKNITIIVNVNWHAHTVPVAQK